MLIYHMTQLKSTNVTLFIYIYIHPWYVFMAKKNVTFSLYQKMNGTPVDMIAMFSIYLTHTISSMGFQSKKVNQIQLIFVPRVIWNFRLCFISSSQCLWIHSYNNGNESALYSCLPHKKVWIKMRYELSVCCFMRGFDASP